MGTFKPLGVAEPVGRLLENVSEVSERFPVLEANCCQYPNKQL